MNEERTLGEIAFAAYREHYIRVAQTGYRIYEWNDLHENQRQCWEVAAQAVAKFAEG